MYINKKSTFFSLFFLYFLPLFSQLTLKVTSVPTDTPLADDIYVAGNFNNWSANQTKLNKNQDGTYSVTLNIAAGNYEYKYTRGAWAKVEGNASGSFLPNRKISYDGSKKTILNQIESWEGTSSQQHTATTNVRVIEEKFFMPQFNRTRRIWIYLPQDYLTNLQKTYRVLYMQDGQNLFDKFYAFGEEWRIDETLNKLFDNFNDEGTIVIGIDNGGTNRIGEYTPYINTKYGGGDGDKYIQFIVNTLKPYIDQKFRTKPQREYTGIGGSSLGGLISFYGAMKHQNVFSRALIFSPSFWWHSDIFKMVEDEGKQQPMKIFLMAGGNEEPDDDVVIKTQKMYQSLQDEGFTKNEVFFATHPDGTHSEWYWAREFGPAYDWLWGALVKTNDNIEREADFSAYPNPADDYIRVHLPRGFENIKIEIKDIRQKIVIKSTVSQGDTISLDNLPKGIYTIDFKKNQRIMRTQKLIVTR